MMVSSIWYLLGDRGTYSKIEAVKSRRKKRVSGLDNEILLSVLLDVMSAYLSREGVA